jgi:hypothetical protein
MVWVLVLLLVAAVAGILGVVIKITLIIVLSAVLAVVLLVGGGFYYLRWRLRKLLRQGERTQSGRGYPTRGTKRPDAGPELPR